jgi:hypothetical protein
MERIFKGKGDFEAINKARLWLKKKGYSYGTMQGDSPIGIKKGDHSIPKWIYISSDESVLLDGTITSRDFRNGPVKITIK